MAVGFPHFFTMSQSLYTEFVIPATTPVIPGDLLSFRFCDCGLWQIPESRPRLIPVNAEIPVFCLMNTVAKTGMTRVVTGLFRVCQALLS